jgi:PAS domain S-box-containing protein
MPHPQRQSWKEAEAELFRLLVENLQDYAVFVVDPQGRVQTWNSGAERLLGYREDEIIGQPGNVFFTPEDIQAGVPQQEMREAMQGGRGSDDRWHVRKDGSRFWSGGMMTPLRDEAGNLRGFAKIMRDRTEWKRQEEALKESEERHRAIADLTSDFASVCRVDEDGSIAVEFVTEGFQKVTGYSLEEMNALGGWKLLVPPDDLPVVQQSIDHWLSGKDHSSEIRIITKRGDIRWLTYLGRSASDPRQGRVTRLLTAAQDITERKQAQERLREQQEWLAGTLASIGDAVIATDTLGRVTFLNGVAEELTGWTQPDAQGRPLETVFHILNEQTRQPVENPVQKVLREGVIAGLANHTVLIGKNGSERPIDDSAAPIRDGAGNLIGVVLVFRDVTEKRQAERMLQEWEHELQLVTDHAPAFLAHCDREGRYKFVNKSYAERFGLTPKDVIGKRIPEVVGEQAYASFRDYVEAALAGRAVEFEVEIPYEKIGRHVMHCAYAPEFDGSGQVQGLVAVINDVTLRKRAENALRESEGRFRSLSACSPVGIFTTDTEGHCTYTNPRCQTICGFAFEDSLGEGWASFVHPEDRQRAFEEWTAAARGGREYSGEFRWRHRDGEVRWSFVRSSPMLSDQGQLLGHVGTVEDITERREIEKALQESRERLDFALQAAELGQWELSLADHTASRNLRHDQIFGYESLLPEWTYEIFLSHVVPEDRTAVDAKFRQAVASNEPWEFECRIRRADGALRWIWARGRAFREDHGQPRRMIGTVADVTQRKQIETELRDARSRLDAALAAGAIVTWAWDIPNNRLFSDGNLARLFNLPTSEADGGLLETYVQSIHPDDWPKVSAALNRSVETGKDYEADYRIVQADGSLRWVTARGSVERDGSGRAVRMPGVLVDITDRKRAEEELRHRERVSRFLAEATTALAALTDYESTLRRVAEVAVPFFADWCVVDIAEADGVLRRLAIAHVDPAKVELIYDLRHRYPPRPTDPHGPQNVLRTGQPEMAADISDAVLAAVAQDEDHLHILRGLDLRSYICVPLAVRGRTLGVLTFVTAESGRTYGPDDLRLAEDLAHRVALAVDNATLYKTAQDALRQKEESLALLDTLQQNAPVGFAFVDREFRYVRINEALAAIDGSVPEYHLGRTVQESVPKLWPRLEPLYRRVLESGEPVTNREITGETPAEPGQTRHWLVNYYPVRVHGEVVGIGVLVVDITDRKRLEDELRQQAKQLTEADRRKDEFLATLAHELRNPLAPIRNSLQILKMPRVDAATAQQTRDMMERQVHHLVRLVDDLLDVSRVMRGKIELHREPVELATVVARAVETAKPLIEVQGHKLDISLPPDSLLLNADPVRLAQVVGNLLTNSAKYTEANGHIWLTAHREGDQAVLRVRDNGIGIAPDMLPHVFELFVQADHATTRAQGGLGIGLTLVKNLVGLHGGLVEAHSAGLGKGCEFVVRLPLMSRRTQPPGDSARAEQGPAAAASGHRLLVVDDNRDAAFSLSMLLRLQGHEVKVAHDGLSALETAMSFRPVLIFLDLGMPKMDGYEVARRIRTTPGLENVVLAALTGWGQEEDRRRTAEAGFDHHLVKPPEPQALVGVLAALPQRL